jgi:tetratricopeptide (TPR) repeat protein
MACLDERRQVAGHLARLFEQGKPAVIDQAPAAVAELASVDGCADLKAIMQLAPLPEGPAQRAEVQRLSDIADQLEALVDASQTQDADAISLPAVEAAAKLGYKPVWARLRYLQGRVDGAHGREVAVLDAFREAAALAIEGQDDRSACRSLRWLAFEEGFGRHHFREGRAALRLAKALEIRFGSPDAEEAGIQYTEAVLDESEGRWEEGLQAIQRGRDLVVRTKGEGSPSQIAFDNVQAALLQDLGHLDEALAVFQKTAEMVIRTSGANNVGMVTSELNQAEVLRFLKRDSQALELDQKAVALTQRRGEVVNTYELNELAHSLRLNGRLPEALQSDRQALAMFEAGPGDNDYRKSLCLLGVGLDLIGMDKPKDAIEPLESSVALQGSLGRPGWETDAALARALWDGGGDRRRAVALAQQAHDLLTPLSVRYGAQYKEEAAVVDGWLGAHTLSP